MGSETSPSLRFLYDALNLKLSKIL